MVNLELKSLLAINECEGHDDDVDDESQYCTIYICI